MRTSDLERLQAVVERIEQAAGRVLEPLRARQANDEPVGSLITRLEGVASQIAAQGDSGEVEGARPE